MRANHLAASCPHRQFVSCYIDEDDIFTISQTLTLDENISMYPFENIVSLLSLYFFIKMKLVQHRLQEKVCPPYVVN